MKGTGPRGFRLQPEDRAMSFRVSVFSRSVALGCDRRELWTDQRSRH